MAAKEVGIVGGLGLLWLVLMVAAYAGIGWVLMEVANTLFELDWTFNPHGIALGVGAFILSGIFKGK